VVEWAAEKADDQGHDDGESADIVSEVGCYADVVVEVNVAFAAIVWFDVDGQMSCLFERDVIVEWGLCWDLGRYQVQVSLWMKVRECLEGVYQVACGL
jgi:hypothetical protein